MKKNILFILLGLGYLFSAELLEISADRFSSNEKTGESIVEGNVHVKKGQDTLNSKKMLVYTNEKRQLSKIIAQGDVVFSVTTQDGRKMNGKAETLTYNAISGEYHLQKNAEIKEQGKANSIKGDEIFLNNKTGYINVVGDKDRPAKLIFNLEETKQ